MPSTHTSSAHVCTPPTDYAAELRRLVLSLNPEATTIGGGMLAQLQSLAASATVVAMEDRSFAALPLASTSPSLEERARWINVLDPLLRYAGRPGDWGRESKLGLLTMRLLQVRAELADESTLAREGGTE